MKNFREDFYKFKNKLETGENFAFSRFSDGELYILQNKELKLDQNLIQIGDQKQLGPYSQQDYKHFDPNKHFHFRNDLIASFKHRQFNYYKGISCSCCVGKENFDWQIELHGGDDESLTWANLWVNGNYGHFINEIVPILTKRVCVFVGHHDADINQFPWIIKDFRVGYNAMVNDIVVIYNIEDWIVDNNIENHVFLFSASSFSNLAIFKLFSDHPYNTYIDIGTTLAPLMNMPAQRAYLQAYWNYQRHPDLEKICIWN